MDTPRIGPRADGYPDADPYGSSPLARGPNAERDERNASYARMEALISSGTEGWTLPPNCGAPSDPGHDFARCGNEAIAQPALFLRQPTDASAVDPRDVQQGQVGDCYFMAALCAFTATAEGRAAVQGAIHENKDDRGQVVSYTVTFHQPEKTWWLWGATRFRDVQVTVDGNYPVVQARPRELGPAQEVWPLVMERAYAQYSGGYDAIAQGGEPWTVMQLLTGRVAARSELSDGYGASELQRDVAAGKLVVLATKGGRLEHGLEEHHSYAVNGLEERDGKLFIGLRNPWGFQDPDPVPIEEIGRWFHAVDVGSVR